MRLLPVASVGPHCRRHSSHAPSSWIIGFRKFTSSVPEFRCSLAPTRRSASIVDVDNRTWSLETDLNALQIDFT
jgi:hypothetical protein